jgi:O-antigen/teichoic acid export membrane protein
VTVLAARASLSLWALTDQGVVSLGTFLTSVLLARTLVPAEYGVFTLIFGAVIFLNGIQGSLIGFPLSVKAAKAEQRGVQELTTAALLLTTGLAVLLGLVVAAMVLWQLQDCFRRALMAGGRFRVAIDGDTVSFLGQAALL